MRKGMNTIENRMQRHWKHEYRNLFLLGGLIGVLCFICVYGIRILDVTYDAWLMNTDIDLRQHYLGWCHFRNSDWHLPIGLIDSLSYPTSVSVIWTDSIPLFAVVFKLLRGILPETFQYFGWFGLISFALQGGIAALLIRKATDCKLLCLLTTPFFILSFPILQRLYYHTALAAQWIPMLALLIWFYYDRKKTVKMCVVWAGMGVLCVFVHSYFVPMVGLLLLGSLADEIIRSHEKKSTFHRLFLVMASFCTAVLASLFILGAFYENASPIGEGIGTFGSNLNTFINPLNHSALFSGLPLYYDFQYEGFGYLGAGMLLLFIGAIGILSMVWVRNRIHINKSFLKRHASELVLTITALVFILLAVLPMVTIGDIKLLGVPYPSFIKNLMNIFRSNGRFIWVPMYVIMFGTIAIYVRYLPYNKEKQSSDDHKERSQNNNTKRASGNIDRRIHRNTILAAIMVFGLLLQFVDASKMIGEKQNYFMKTEQTYEPFWNQMEEVGSLSQYKHFVFMYPENDWMMDTAYYAYFHDMTLNHYYYARSYEKQIMNQIEQYYNELAQGMIRDDVIYIFRENDISGNPIPEELQLTEFENHVIGTKYGL